MANRKGVFIGAYVPNHLKESLRRRAAAEHRTLSQEITRILEEAVHGKGLPAGSVDRRNKETTPRRRATDPAPRRRTIDVAYVLQGTRQTVRIIRTSVQSSLACSKSPAVLNLK